VHNSSSKRRRTKDLFDADAVLPAAEPSPEPPPQPPMDEAFPRDSSDAIPFDAEPLSEPPSKPPSEPPVPPPILLTGEQIDAHAAIRDFLAGAEQVFCLQGLAGTGKTTLLAAVAQEIGSRAFLLGPMLTGGFIQGHGQELLAGFGSLGLLLAPIGKAATVLSRKTGEPAFTLHRFLYTSPDEGEDGRLIFDKRSIPPGTMAGMVALVDEASMVTENIGLDLLETGIRVIASLDHGQLPPVEGPAFFGRADFTLREVRRRAADNPILRQAYRVRQGPDYETDGDAFRVISKRAALDCLRWADIVLCYKNTTRHKTNAFMRRAAGIPPDAPARVGEPLICLRNAPLHGVMNGEIFTVAAAENGRFTLDNGVTFDRPWFEWLHIGEKEPRRRDLFGLAYAITVHKAQGSEWPRVLVVDEFHEILERPRWLYTAITRASEAVRIAR